MVTNDIRVCDKCQFYSLKSIVPKLEKLAEDCQIQVGCKSYCGPCSQKAFVFINGRYVTGRNEAEVLAKVKPLIRKAKPKAIGQH